MPVFDNYSLYGNTSGLSSSTLSYSTLLYLNRGSSSSSGLGLSSNLGLLSSSGNYYGTGRRYSPLLPTIVESSSPTIGRRHHNLPRSSPVSYTPTNLYTPRSAPVYNRVPKPVKVDTENIDVSTPRKPPRRQEVQDSGSNENSVPRSTIKRGRTVVRIHTKHLKENPNIEKDKKYRKMTPGERLKEKFMIRDDQDVRKKREEENYTLSEAEKAEAEKRFRRLMMMKDPLNFYMNNNKLPSPVQPEVSTITDDLDMTPKNSDSDSDSDGLDSTNSLSKKRLKRGSIIQRDKNAPVPPPRSNKKSRESVKQNFDESRKQTVKRKVTDTKMTSIKGGISKKKNTTKKSKIITNVIDTTIMSSTSPDCTKSPKLFIENIVVEDQILVTVKTPPLARKFNFDVKNREDLEKQTANKCEDKKEDKIQQKIQIENKTVETKQNEITPKPNERNKNKKETIVLTSVENTKVDEKIELTNDNLKNIENCPKTLPKDEIDNFLTQKEEEKKEIVEEKSPKVEKVKKIGDISPNLNEKSGLNKQKTNVKDISSSNVTAKDKIVPKSPPKSPKDKEKSPKINDKAEINKKDNIKSSLFIDENKTEVIESETDVFDTKKKDTESASEAVVENKINLKIEEIKATPETIVEKDNKKESSPISKLANKFGRKDMTPPKSPVVTKFGENSKRDEKSPLRKFQQDKIDSPPKSPLFTKFGENSKRDEKSPVKKLQQENKDSSPPKSPINKIALANKFEKFNEEQKSPVNKIKNTSPPHSPKQASGDVEKLPEISPVIKDLINDTEKISPEITKDALKITNDLPNTISDTTKNTKDLLKVIKDSPKVDEPKKKRIPPPLKLTDKNLDSPKNLTPVTKTPNKITDDKSRVNVTKKEEKIEINEEFESIWGEEEIEYDRRKVQSIWDECTSKANEKVIPVDRADDNKGEEIKDLKSQEVSSPKKTWDKNETKVQVSPKKVEATEKKDNLIAGKKNEELCQKPVRKWGKPDPESEVKDVKSSLVEKVVEIKTEEKVSEEKKLQETSQKPVKKWGRPEPIEVTQTVDKKANTSPVEKIIKIEIEKKDKEVDKEKSELFAENTKKLGNLEPKVEETLNKKENTSQVEKIIKIEIEKEVEKSKESSQKPVRKWGKQESNVENKKIMVKKDEISVSDIQKDNTDNKKLEENKTPQKIKPWQKPALKVEEKKVDTAQKLKPWKKPQAVTADDKYKKCKSEPPPSPNKDLKITEEIKEISKAEPKTEAMNSEIEVPVKSIIDILTCDSPENTPSIEPEEIITKCKIERGVLTASLKPRDYARVTVKRKNTLSSPLNILELENMKQLLDINRPDTAEIDEKNDRLMEKLAQIEQDTSEKIEDTIVKKEPESLIANKIEENKEISPKLELKKVETKKPSPKSEKKMSDKASSPKLETKLIDKKVKDEVTPDTKILNTKQGAKKPSPKSAPKKVEDSKTYAQVLQVKKEEPKLEIKKVDKNLKPEINKKEEENKGAKKKENVINKKEAEIVNKKTEEKKTHGKPQAPKKPEITQTQLKNQLRKSLKAVPLKVPQKNIQKKGPAPQPPKQNNNNKKMPAPLKPLFMNPAFAMIQQQMKNKNEPKPPLRKAQALKNLHAETEKEEKIECEIERPERHTIKQLIFKADRVSTVRHMTLKLAQQASLNTQDSEEEDSSDTETESSGSDTETEDNVNQSKVDRTSTSSEDSGIGSTHTSPLTNKNECSVNCHRKCEKHMPNLCGVNQKLLAEALSSLKKGRTNPGSTKHAGTEGRDGTSPHPTRRFSTSLSSDSESGEEGSARRYTPPARTIPRFRKYTVEDYQFLKVLGKGSFGKVLLAELRGTECYYAVKCLKKDVVLEDDDVECTLIERKVLALGTRHPYLCHLFCTFQTDSHLFFVMEYLNGGDLMFHIQQSGRFEQPRAAFYAAEIVSGLKFLHKKGIVYRDLKLDNILLDYEGHVRIADFGMCKLQIYLDRTADTFCGTPDYMAPEIIKGLHYNQCVDWWSFGVLLYEMLIGQSPFNGCDEDELFWSICNEQPYYPRFLSKEAQTILQQLLEKDSSRRLGTPDCPAGDVFHQPFFKAIDWGALDRKELEPPFKPRVQHALDVQYFDSAFTQEAARLTPVDKEILQSMDQSQFHGFSYTNPNACNE